MVGINDDMSSVLEYPVVSQRIACENISEI